MKKTSADSDYFLRFHLEDDPFSEDGWRYEPYLSSSVERKLEQIAGLLDANCLVLVTAATGGGKSSIARHLVSLMPGPGTTHLVTARKDIDADALAHMLVQGIPPGTSGADANAVTALHRCLEHCDRKQIRQVFIVDNADWLSEEALEFVLQLSLLRYNKTMFHFILLGTEHMADRLPESGQSDAGKTTIRHLHVPAFTPDETGDYLGYRLTASGWDGDMPFTRRDLEFIHRVSGGLPRAINYLARQRLLEYSRASQPRRHGRSAAVIAAILAVAVSTYYLLPRSKAPTAGPAVSQSAEQHHGTMTTASSRRTNHTEPKAPVTSESGSASAALPQPAPAPAGQPATADHVAETSSAKPKVRSQEPAPKLPSAGPAQENAHAEPTAGTTTGDAGGEMQPTAGSAAAAGEGAAATPAQKLAAPTEVAGGEAQTSRWHVEIRGPAWLRAQPTGTYFLQLINASDIYNVKALLKQLNSSKDRLAGYTNFTPSGKPRYLLLYGEYPDRDSASAAIARLPNQIRSIPPWPRSLAGVLHDMDNAKSRGLSP